MEKTAHDSGPDQTGKKQVQLYLVPEGERRFGRYTLFFHLAKGGMAHLFTAQYTGPDGFEKLVAIKRIHENLTNDPEFITMFSDEARLAARISHPNVVQVLELGTVDRWAFISMEYVEGESLGALIKATKIPFPVCARIISQAALGLHSAHELKDIQGNRMEVVHRDVSPQNVLISYDGAVKVVDFGVAKAKSNISQTEAGAVKGKFAYMAPEQLKPNDYGGLDRRTDIFPLGILLYEATTRRNLFRGSSNAQTIERVLYKEITPPSKLVKSYPPRLEEIVMKALQRKKEDRYQTAKEMHLELESYLSVCGEHVVPSTISDLICSVFEEQMQLKSDLLRQAQESLPDPESVSSLHTIMSDSAKAVLHGRARRRVLAIAGAGLAAIAAVILIVVASSRPPEKPKTIVIEKRVKQEPGPVHVLIKAAPKSAKIRFDGKEVKNPFELKRQSEKRKVAVVVQAEGYVPQEFEVSLAEGGRWMVSLEKLPVVQPDGSAAAAASKRPPRRGHGWRWKGPRRPHTKKKVIKDLYTNPYEKRK